MRKDNLIIFVILLGYFIGMNGISSENNKHPCPTVKNDLDVVTLKDFTIPLDPPDKKVPSYAETDQNGHIIYLKITNKTFIPPEIFGLKYLQKLEIRNSCLLSCKHPTISAYIKCFASSLTHLEIYDTNITYLPRKIEELKHLRTLILSNTGLKSLPTIIGNLPELTVLSLTNNHLKSLPKAMIKLRKLKRIILSDNPQLSSIKSLNNLPSLEYIDVRQCSIEDLPRNLPLLNQLYMSANRLTTLIYIETLGYGTNETKSFVFNQNSIDFIPPQIDRITDPFELNLNNNKLDYFLKNFCMMPNLKLSMKNNPYNDTHLKEDCLKLLN